MKYALPKEEIEIGKRLRAFRERLKIPRTKFALEIGITSDQLLGYECGRARLPYKTFISIANRFPTNPRWLATGEGDPDRSLHFPDPVCDPPLSRTTPFSEAFKRFLDDPVQADMYAFRQKIIAFFHAMEELARHLAIRKIGQRLLPDRETRRQITVIQEGMAALLRALEWDTPRLSPAEMEEAAEPDMAYQWIGVYEQIAKKGLTNLLLKDNKISVESPLKALLRRVDRAAVGRGKKTALAKLLKVTASQLSEWIHGVKQPGGEYALRLLEWVTAEEAECKARSDGDNTAAGEKTRSTQSKHETRKTSPKQK